MEGVETYYIAWRGIVSPAPWRRAGTAVSWWLKLAFYFSLPQCQQQSTAHRSGSHIDSITVLQYSLYVFISLLKILQTTDAVRMAPPEQKLWVFLDEALPAVEGNALLGTVVANVQIPTNAYEPKSAAPSRKHPFLTVHDMLEPSFESRNISVENKKSSSFDAGLYSFISGNISSTNTHQATLSSTAITTYSLRSATDVFEKIRSTPAYWKQVEELMRRNKGKPLYFVKGYKVASNPDVTFESSKQRARGGEVTLPLVESLGGVLPLPTTVPIGDPHFGVSLERGSMASQSGTLMSDKLFAIQYWSVVKRREAIQGQKRRLGVWSRTKLTDDISPGITSGNHLKFSGDKNGAGKADGEKLDEEEVDEDDEEDDDDDDDYDAYDEVSDQEEWVLTKRGVDMEKLA